MKQNTGDALRARAAGPSDRSPCGSPSADSIPIAAPCPECEGEGWTQGTDYEDQCCGGSDWECGGRGCTGPIQVQIPIQEQCEACRGTGALPETQA